MFPDLVWTREAPRRFAFYFKRVWKNAKRTASVVSVVLHNPVGPKVRASKRVEWSGPIPLPKEATDGN